jgi:hypothetical protein
MTTAPRTSGTEGEEPDAVKITGGFTDVVYDDDGNPQPRLEGTQWSRADRAKAALLEYQYEATGDHFAGDEGSEEFDMAVVGLLTDLKHLLWRAGGAHYALEDLVQEAIDRWSKEIEILPEGGEEDEDDDGADD